MLEGNGTIGFSTPLATLHIFQGWADVFLTTPTTGIEDFYVKAGYGFAARAALHEGDGDGRLSRLLGASRAMPISAANGTRRSRPTLNANVTLGVKYAAYRGAGPYPDKAIGWLYVGYRY